MLKASELRTDEARRYLREARVWFRAFRRTRPFWGGLWLIIGGWLVLRTGSVTWQLATSNGLSGIGGWLTGGGMVVCGLIAWCAPTQRYVAGIIGLVFAVGSLIAANLGGLFVGMLAGIVGGAMTVAWGPKKPKAAKGSADAAAADDPAAADDAAALEGPAAPDPAYAADDIAAPDSAYAADVPDPADTPDTADLAEPADTTSTADTMDMVDTTDTVDDAADAVETGARRAGAA